MKMIDGGVCAAKGFSAYGLRAGIKEGKTNRDMAMVLSSSPCTSAGTFTLNVVKAAPVWWDKKIVEGGGSVRAVVVNTGYANACTGERGKDDCKTTAAETARVLGVSENEVFVASTGIIGQFLPMDKIISGIPLLAGKLERSKDAADLAAEAIMTTDTLPKQAAASFEYVGKTVTVGGMCKGSGMIHPNMGTMLCFITTDAAVSSATLQKLTSQAVDDTFNMVSVDGDTSTNDTVLVMANGESGVEINGENIEDFKCALCAVMTALAKKVASDGEGATKLMEVTVTGAKTLHDARLSARSVASSSLFKAALFGRDANWGRILCAMGYSGADFDPEKVKITLSDGKDSILIAEHGFAVDFSEEKATEILSAPEVTVLAELNQGDFSATAWGCDLTFDYVSINADYRS